MSYRTSEEQVVTSWGWQIKSYVMIGKIFKGILFLQFILESVFGVKLLFRGEFKIDPFTTAIIGKLFFRGMLLFKGNLEVRQQRRLGDMPLVF
jgi:hypothetical protein